MVADRIKKKIRWDRENHKNKGRVGLSLTDSGYWFIFPAKTKLRRPRARNCLGDRRNRSQVNEGRGDLSFHQRNHA
jgi:hypothetical protein